MASGRAGRVLAALAIRDVLSGRFSLLGLPADLADSSILASNDRPRLHKKTRGYCFGAPPGRRRPVGGIVEQWFSAGFEVWGGLP